jgi:hypothetical protein
MCEQHDPSETYSDVPRIPAPRVRQGWAEAAQEMATRGDDALIDQAAPPAFDEEEWAWW